MANKTKTSGMLLTSITMVILIITSSATGLIITKQNWKKFLKDHPLALILCYSSIHGPSMVLKEDLEDSSHLLAFENNKIRVGYLDVHSHPDTFPQASNASEIPFISFYFHKKHFILTKPNLTVVSI